MSVRPFRNIKRRKTKEIKVGNVKVGGDNPISVQSMTNTLTTDTKATINQINKITKAVKLLFHNSNSIEINIKNLPKALTEIKEIKEIIKFIELSKKRGVCRYSYD